MLKLCIQCTFNVMHITSKLFQTYMSETVHPKLIHMPYTELVDMFMACLHTKSYTSSYKSSPATAIKQKQKKSFASASHYCTFYQKLISTEVAYFFLGPYRVKQHSSGTQSLSIDAQDIKRKLLLFSLKVIPID